MFVFFLRSEGEMARHGGSCLKRICAAKVRNSLRTLAGRNAIISIISPSKEWQEIATLMEMIWSVSINFNKILIAFNRQLFFSKLLSSIKSNNVYDIDDSMIADIFDNK